MEINISQIKFKINFTEKKLIFRVWDKKSKTMLPPLELYDIISNLDDGYTYSGHPWEDLVQDDLSESLPIDITGFIPFYTHKDSPVATEIFIAYLQDTGHRFLFLQDTGLKDKNKTSIFDGDIIKGWKNDLVGFITYEGGAYIIKYVDWDNKCIKVYWPFDNVRVGKVNDDKYKTYEVIGNVFENPELLSL